MDIKNLVRAVKEGSEEGKIDLIERLKPIRIAMTKRYSKHGKEEDDDQDLIILMLESITNYNEEESSFPWYIRELSRFHMLDKKKKLDDKYLEDMEVDGLSILEVIPDDGESVEELSVNIERRNLLKSKIRELPEIQSKIINLKFYEDKSGVEIANILHTSQTTVSRELKKALKSLRRKVNDYR